MWTVKFEVAPFLRGKMLHNLLVMLLADCSYFLVSTKQCECGEVLSVHPNAQRAHLAPAKHAKLLVAKRVLPRCSRDGMEENGLFFDPLPSLDPTPPPRGGGVSSWVGAWIWVPGCPGSQGLGALTPSPPPVI